MGEYGIRRGVEEPSLVAKLKQRESAKQGEWRGKEQKFVSSSSQDKTPHL